MTESRDLYRNIVENNADAIIILRNRVIVYANKKVALLYGVDSVDDLIGSNIMTYLSDSDQEKLAKLEKLPFTSEELKQTFKFQGLMSDGETVPLMWLLAASPMMEMRGTLLTIRDVTRRIKSVNKIKALHESTALLGRAINWHQAAEAVLITIKDLLRFDYASVGVVKGDELVFAHFLGESTIKSLPLDEGGITVRAIRSGVTQYVKDTRKDPDFLSSRKETNGMSLSELDVPVILEGEPIAVLNLENLKPNGFTSEDIQMIEILADHLGSAIQRINSVKDLSEMREEHLFELIGGIDKICKSVQMDLKGPIHGLKNSSYLLRHNPEFVPDIVDSLDHNITLIEETLSEMKEITDPTNTEKNLTDIYVLLNQAITLSQIPHNIQLETRFKEDFLAANIDQEKIKRVFYNILRNSIEAMPSGGTIEVSTRLNPETVRIQFKDNGPGIPDDVIDEVFKPFFSTKPHSLGLGLSFCKMAVESNGGSFNLDSKEEGTVVTIHLPL